MGLATVSSSWAGCGFCHCSVFLQSFKSCQWLTEALFCLVCGLKRFFWVLLSNFIFSFQHVLLTNHRRGSCLYSCPSPSEKLLLHLMLCKPPSDGGTERQCVFLSSSALASVLGRPCKPKPKEQGLCIIQVSYTFPHGSQNLPFIGGISWAWKSFLTLLQL